MADLVEEQNGVAAPIQEEIFDETTTTPSEAGNEKARILWVYEESNIIHNAMAHYKGERVWIRHIPKTNRYNVVKITKHVADYLDRCHVDRSNKTGVPVYHGGPTIIQRTAAVELLNAPQEGIEAQWVDQAITITYQMPFDQETIQGEVITTLAMGDFSNYRVPRTVIVR